MSSYLYATAAGRRGDPNDLTVGESTIPRMFGLGNAGMSSQTIRFAYFTATKTETIANIRVVVATTAAAPTPSLIRFGVYSVAGNGDLTQVAATANDTTLLAATNTAYSKAFTASWTKTTGVRYAVGLLVVTAAAAPNISSNNPVTTSEMAQDPKTCGTTGGQADLPGSIVAANVAASNATPYFALVP